MFILIPSVANSDVMDHLSHLNVIFYLMYIFLSIQIVQCCNVRFDPDTIDTISVNLKGISLYHRTKYY